MQYLLDFDRFLRRHQPPPIPIPPAIQAALQNGAALVVSISGGKDSEAMMRGLAAHPSRPTWTGPIVLVHADLGDAEWPQTPGVVEAHAESVGWPLTVVTRSDGMDLYDRFEDRLEKVAGTGKPFWPDSARRYCTSDLKRGPIDKYLRQFDFVVSAEGIRAEESEARAQKPVVELRSQITGKAYRQAVAGLDEPDEAAERAVDLALYGDDGEPVKGRLALNWRPIHGDTLPDVWARIGTSVEDLDRRRQLYRDGRHAEALAGWTSHPAYVIGNERLSCAFCVLGCKSDIQNAAREFPDKLRRLVGMELRSGATFKSSSSLADVAYEEYGSSYPLPVLSADSLSHAQPKAA